MFPNLEAEQARRNHTDRYVAGELSITRQTYGRKKEKGHFKMIEINRLLEIYGMPFEYLFSERERR